MRIDRRHFLQGAIASTTALPLLDSSSAAPAETDIRLACRTAAWSGGTFSEATLVKVAATGFGWIEASENEVQDYQDRPEELKRPLDASGVGLATVTVAGDFVDSSQRLQNIRRAMGIARLLEALGSPLLLLKNSGGPLAKPSDFLRLAGHLAEVGALVYEETGLYCAYDFDELDAAAIRKIIAISDSRYVKFCFDARVLERLGLDAAAMVRAYGDRVMHVRAASDPEMSPAVATLASELIGFGYRGWIAVDAPRDAAGVVRQALEETVANVTPATPTRRVDDVAGRTQPVARIPVRDPYFEPMFFSSDEYRDLSALVDAVIPATDTPGALAAGADEYADLMTWLDEDNHTRSRKQVAAFRRLCASRYRRPFAELGSSEATEFLGRLAAGDRSGEEREAGAFFAQARALAVRAYYASPPGLLGELGYQGNDYLPEFEGCTHPEHGA